MSAVEQKAAIDSPEFAVLYFSAPGEPKVRVFEANDFKGGGGGVTDFGQMPEPLYLHVGDVRLVFGCPNDTEFSYGHFMIINLPTSGEYYLYCDAEHRMGVRPHK